MRTRIIAGIVAVLFATRASAIEDFRIAIQNTTNIVLSWPSVAGETYIIQTRASWDTNSPWTTLTSSYPPASGTNRTTYTLLGVVPPPPQQQQGGGGGGSPPPPPSPQSAQTSSASSGGVTTTKKIEWPPVPWDESTWPKAKATSSRSGGGVVTMDADNGEGDVTCNFYRVVRTGLHIVDLPANVSGLVTVHAELGILPVAGELTGFSISDADTNRIAGMAPDLDVLSAQWNSSSAQNGSYTLVPSVQIGPQDELLGSAKSTLVHNDIRFPNGFPVAGEAMRIEAQTVDTNGTWHMDIFNEFDQLLGQLDGVVDENGFCNLAGFEGPGFSLGLADNNGNPLPWNSYLIAAVTTPAGGGPSKTNTMRQFVERPWSHPTKWAVAYMPIYTSGTTSDTQLYDLVGHAIGVCRGVYGLDGVVNSLGDTPIPFKLRFTADWLQLASDLVKNEDGKLIVRNFFYFGHGSPSSIGGTTNTQLSMDKKFLRSLFRNAPDPLEGFGLQPFRFVFLDGCATAKSDFCEAFGIPEGTYSSAEFLLKRGLRQRVPGLERHGGYRGQEFTEPGPREFHRRLFRCLAHRESRQARSGVSITGRALSSCTR